MTLERLTKITSIGISSGIQLYDPVFVGVVTATKFNTENINATGVSTLGNTVVGGGTTQLIVTGDARITGILTIGTSSVTLDGTNNQVNVGTGVTIHHTNGVQVGGNTVHSTGLTINQINVGTGASISSPATNILALGTNSTEAIRIDSNGNLGIGTANPINTLHVVGSSRFISNGYPGAYFGTGAGVINFGYQDGFDGAELSVSSSMGQGKPLFLNATGNGAVLINSFFPTGNTSQRLQVTGGAYVSGNLGIGTTTNGTLGNFAQPNLYIKQTATDWTGGIHIESTSDQSVGTISMNSSGFEFGQSYRTSGQYRDINFYASGVKSVTIDTSGRLRLPYQPSFRVYSPSGAANSIITFGSTEYNIGGHMNASTGVFTAPIAGRYLFTFSILSGNPFSSYVRIGFCKNSTTMDTTLGDSLWDGLNTYGSPGMSMIFSLAANDTIRLRVEGSAVYGTSYGSFSGCLIG